VVEVGDLVRDKHIKWLGFGCIIKGPHRPRHWDGEWACEVYWSITKEVGLRRASWLEVINDSR
jgi:hypothetical protein